MRVIEAVAYHHVLVAVVPTHRLYGPSFEPVRFVKGELQFSKTLASSHSN